MVNCNFFMAIQRSECWFLPLSPAPAAFNFHRERIFPCEGMALTAQKSSAILPPYGEAHEFALGTCQRTADEKVC